MKFGPIIIHFRTPSNDWSSLVITHEIGHLLLGSGAQFFQGIMLAQWGAKQLQYAAVGNLLFTSTQTKHTQAEAIDRTRARDALQRRFILASRAGGFFEASSISVVANAPFSVAPSQAPHGFLL